MQFNTFSPSLTIAFGVSLLLPVVERQSSATSSQWCFRNLMCNLRFEGASPH
ncbi:hypothetical protein CLU87_1128 [Acidovorax sp. 59]|nr:hypothetical protein CLU87_1128 [Acidovorax sp. 59]